MKVLKENRERENNFVIVEDDSIKNKNLCECHNEYGIQLGCYDAGCYTAETSDNFKNGDEETHIEVEVYEYHDGHNWRSLLVSGGSYPSDLTSVTVDIETEILNHYKKAVWSKWHNGICKGITDKYEFIKSQWQGSFGIADVNQI